MKLEMSMLGMSDAREKRLLQAMSNTSSNNSCCVCVNPIHQGTPRISSHHVTISVGLEIDSAYSI